MSTQRGSRPAVSNSPVPNHYWMTAITFVVLPKPAAYKHPLRVLVTGFCTKGIDTGLRLKMADKRRANRLLSTKTAVYDNIEYPVPGARAIKNKHPDRSLIVSNDANKIFIALLP